MVIRSGQQVLLVKNALRFTRKVEFEPPEDGAVRRLLPAGAVSPVVIDPLVRFGRPSVEGVATERLWELFDAGEPVEKIAASYELAEGLSAGCDRVRGAVAITRRIGGRGRQVLC